MGKTLKKIAKNKTSDQMTTRERMAFNAGKKVGLDEGKAIGIESSIKYFTEKMETLSEIKGIGEQRFKQICFHLGFREIGEKNENAHNGVPERSSQDN